MTELKLTDYLHMCAEFEKDGSEEKEEAIKTFLSELVVKEYMPLKEKVMHSMEILSTVPRDYDAPGAAGNIENGKVVFGLLGYCVNLENDTGIIGRTFSVYDMLMEHGLAKKILEVSKDDYATFCGMVSDMINISNMERLVETAALQSTTEYDKWVDTMKEVKTSLTPEMIRDLLAINEKATGGLSDLDRQLATEGLQQAEVAVANDEKLAQVIRDAAAARVAERESEEAEEEVAEETSEDNT